MDQRGGCCIARYAGGAYDTSKVDRIMLRFRPIAPKPASTIGSLSGGGSGGSSPVKSTGISASTGRGRRRRASKDSVDSSVKKRNGIGGRKRKAVSSGGKVVKTLPLMPETTEAEESKKMKVSQSRDRRNRRPLWLSFGSAGDSEAPAADRLDLGDPTAAVAKEAGVRRSVLVWSWVRVECVTDTCAVGCYGYGNLGVTDEERLISLDLDTCPGFISDGLNRVKWMNAEYRMMVGGEGAAAEGEVVAWVVLEEGVKMPAAAAFTCRVKVVTWEKEKKSRTLPCDVWRMDCGGFAWRLDTKAALSLAL